MWGSLDGHAWQTVNSPGEGFGADVLVDGDRVIVVGLRDATGAGRAAVWLGQIRIRRRPHGVALDRGPTPRSTPGPRSTPAPRTQCRQRWRPGA